jgi:hypothetical protein
MFWTRLGEIRFLLQQGTSRCVLGARPFGIKLPAITLLSYVRSLVPHPLSQTLDLHLTCEPISHTAHTPNGARYEDQDQPKTIQNAALLANCGLEEFLEDHLKHSSIRRVTLNNATMPRTA